MYLTDLIKALTDVLAEVGDCQVVITTENENKMYDTTLIHYIPKSTLIEEPFLRLEGITDREENKDE